jgi:hypothetical protein
MDDVVDDDVGSPLSPLEYMFNFRLSVPMEIE